MADPANFWNDLWLVIIPVLIGGGVSTGIVSVWQIQKERFRLKKEKFELRTKIHKLFQESYGIEYNSHLDFWEKIKDHYISDWKLISKENKEVSYGMVFSDSDENFPIKVFANEFINFKKQTLYYSKKGNELYSLITIYFDSKELYEKYREMSNAAFFSSSMFKVFFTSKTIDELKSNFAVLDETIRDFRDKCTNFAQAISNTKLKNPPD